MYPSTAVEDGFSDTLNRKMVYDADSVFGGMMEDNKHWVAHHEADDTKDKGKGKAKDELMAEPGADDDVQTEVGMPLDWGDGPNMDGCDMDDPKWMVTEQEGFGSDIEESDEDGDGKMEGSNDGEDSDTTII